MNRRVLAEAGDSIKRFLDSGVTELGARLGPLLWQFTPYKKFDEKDFGKFLELLPANFDGRALRHVVEVRNDSFKTPAFIALLRQFGVAVVYAEHDTYTEIADITADFVYARLQKGDEKLKAGYAPKALDAWAKRAQIWARGGEPKDLPRVDKKSAAKKPRDTFIYFIHEAKAARAGGGDGADRKAWRKRPKCQSRRSARPPRLHPTPPSSLSASFHHRL